jgi:tRNA threonylcarbamoyladenosine biosynthesis protein TsaB
MSLILHINTALSMGSVSLADDDRVIAERTSDQQSEHASFLQPAIRDLLQDQGLSLRDLSALAVVYGPGSYTGLRVGMACAKGICYALNLPLITVGTLEWMASAATGGEAPLICPMIDARRDEVFTALYDRDGKEVRPPFAAILDGESFGPELQQGKVHFLGNGAEKFERMIQHANAIFTPVLPGCYHLSLLSRSRFRLASFSEVTYTEPMYVKDFHTPSGKRKAP